MGGVEKVMWDLTSGLGERGIKCDMLCAILHKSRHHDRVSFMRINDHARCICVQAVTMKAATMICPGMITYLRKHCEEYDIIHVHHPDPMAALALQLSGYKGRVILHWHSDILKQKALLKMYLPLQNWLIKRADKIIGTTPVYIASSPYLTKVQDKCDYLPIGIKKVPVDEAKVRFVQDKFRGRKIVFSLGRMVEYKGYEYLINAAKYLPDDYVVVIGGKGPLFEDYKEMIAEEGLKDKVILLGYLNDLDLKIWMKACTIFALSSIIKTEAFAIVQIEAMSAGRPIVATNIPGSGVPWVNKDGFSGMNVPIKDSEAIAKAIVEITKDPEIYAGYCARSYQRYEEMFTKDIMIDNLLKKYGIVQ